MPWAAPKNYAVVAALTTGLAGGPVLAATPEPAPPRPVDACSAPTPVPPSRGERAGTAVLMLGGLGSLAGFTLLGVGVRYEPDEPGFLARKDFRPAGAAVLGISFALAVAGAIVFGVDRRSRRGTPNVSVAPVFLTQQAGLSLVGRF